MELRAERITPPRARANSSSVAGAGVLGRRRRDRCERGRLPPEVAVHVGVRLEVAGFEDDGEVAEAAHHRVSQGNDFHLLLANRGPCFCRSLPKGSPCIIKDELYGEVYAEIVGLMPCKKEVHVWMPHFNTYAVVGRKTINPIKNRREDFDYLDYSQPPLQLQPPFANSNGGGSGNSGQGPYDGVREGAAQQQPPQPEWLPSVQPSFCTVRSISFIAVSEQLLIQHSLHSARPALPVTATRSRRSAPTRPFTGTWPRRRPCDSRTSSS